MTEAGTPAPAPTAAVRSEHSAAFVRLGQLWQRRSHFSLVFAAVDSPLYRDALIARLDALHPAARIDPPPGDETGGGAGGPPTEWLQALSLAWAQGHDRVHMCLPLAPRRSDAWWQQANLLRERLADAFAGVQVLWLSEADADAAAHQAPDLWNWRETVLTFTTTATFAAAPELSSPRFAYYTDQNAAAVAERLVQIEAHLSSHNKHGISEAHLMLEAAQAYERVGQWTHSQQKAQLAADLFDREGDSAHAALALRQVAEVTFMSGRPDEAMKILTERVLPIFVRLGDAHSEAVTLGHVADILQTNGQLNDALHIRRSQELPVFERLGDVREKAVTIGKVADILHARGQIDEALRLRLEQELPVYERLGDVRAKAVAMGKVADVLQAAGELDEALRIRRDEELPVFERLGDLHSKAVTMGKVADILQARGQLDEALRIERQEVLPVFVRLGDTRSKTVCMFKIAEAHALLGQIGQARDIWTDKVLPVFQALGMERQAQITRDRIAALDDAVVPKRP